MGEDFHGPAIVDRWRVFSYLTIIQRCWAYMIREVESFKSSGIGMKLSGEIHSMFTELNESLKSRFIYWRKSMNTDLD